MATPILDGYRDLQPIGRGGFSRVYRARQDKFARDVAIKVINTDLSDVSERTAFQHEAKLIGTVSTHPNIVTVHDTAYTQEGDACLIMELYSGGTLAQRVRKHGPIGPAQLLQIAVAVTSALDVAHRAGILHRDIKPQNVFISDFGQPALGDFGISTIEMDRTGDANDNGLTLHYAAPEVIEGSRSSVTSDLYSLGATLYTIAAGRRPFDAPDGRKQARMEVQHKILTQRPPSLTLYNQPEAVDRLLQQLMSKSAGSRPQSAAEVLGMLLALQERLGYAPSSTVQELLPSAPAAAPPTVSTPSPERHDTTDIPLSTIRRVGGLVAGAAVLLGIGALIWFLGFASGPDEQDPIPEPRTQPTVSPELAPEEVFAPVKPERVSVTRNTDGTVVVDFEHPDADDPDSDVEFQIRRTDINAPPIFTGSSSVELTDVEPGTTPCVVIIALRSNRTASPTDPACAP